MKIWAAALLAGMIIMLPLSADTAPFCVEAKGVARNCAYYDAQQCRREAFALHGNCIVEADLLRNASGTQRFCLVDATEMARCLYTDIASCERDAKRNNSICVLNKVPDKQPKKPENPYQYEVERNN